MPLSRYLKVYPCPEKPGHFLLYSTKRASSLLLPASLLQSAETEDLGLEHAETLSRLGILVEDLAREKEEIIHWFTSANKRSRKFSAMLCLNLDCNLACTYCYENFIRGKKKYMPSEVAEAVLNLVREQASGGRDIHLDFHGGEPLLSLPLIRRILDEASCSARKAGTCLSAGMVTNGTLLTRSVAEDLASRGLAGAKFTLDGPPDVHNLSRPFVSGEGSFDMIFRNIAEVWDILDVQIGGNFNSNNFKEFPRLLDLLLKEGLTPEKIRLVKFDPVMGRAGVLPEHSVGCSSLDEPWLREAALFLREEILKRGFHTPKISPAACMIEFENDVIVGFDGKLYKCPGLIGLPEMEVGTIFTGLTDYRETYNLDVWKNDECLDCVYLPMCFGGCRLLKFLRDGSIDGVDCQRDFYDATLEKLILQDIKYRSAKK